MNQRMIHYDLLRIIAAYLIIVLHLSVAMSEEYFFSALSRIGVPLFVMISGAFLLHPSKKIDISLIFKKYLPRVLLLFVIWSAFYAFIWQKPYLNGLSNFDWRLFWEMFSVGHYHLWYLYMLAGLYLITPFIRILTKYGDKQLLTYFLALCLILTTITKMNSGLLENEILTAILDKLSLTFVFGYVGYYVAGYYFKHFFAVF